jgi:hypothetical protein
MKLIKVLMLGIIALSANNSFAFFMFVADAKLEEGQVEASIYKYQHDIKENIRELKKLDDWVVQLARMQKQITNLVNLNKTAMNTFRKAEHMVMEHGDWEDIDWANILSDVHKYKEDKMHTTTSILNDIEGAPEKVVDNSTLVKKFVKKIDVKNWTQAKQTKEEKITPSMLAWKQYQELEDYSNKLHGYTDEEGTKHEGYLSELNFKIGKIDKKLEHAKTDVEVTTLLKTRETYEREIRTAKQHEESLEIKYNVALLRSGHAKEIKRLITENRMELIQELDANDKEIRTPSQKDIIDHFKKQEEEAIS